MENINYILSLAGTALSLLAACLTFAVKFIKAVKDRKELISRELIVKALPEFIERAEQFPHYDGQEKKEYVMTKINRFAIENNIAFDDKTISDMIEELIKLTKEVNKKNNNPIEILLEKEQKNELHMRNS